MGDFFRTDFVGKRLSASLHFRQCELLEIGAVDSGHPHGDRRDSPRRVHPVQTSGLARKSAGFLVNDFGHPLHEHFLASRPFIGVEIDVAHPEGGGQGLRRIDVARFFIWYPGMMAEIGIARGIDQPPGTDAEKPAPGPDDHPDEPPIGSAFHIDDHGMKPDGDTRMGQQFIPDPLQPFGVVVDAGARTIEIYDTARSLGCVAPRLSLDSNEGNKDAAEVEEYLLTLREQRPDVFQALEYLEQPTGRDITVHQHNWQAVSKLKPVLLDEGLTDLALLPLAKEQGWSGLALKTCKGHSFTLIAAAWAREQGIPLAMQDLTNPGYAAIHSWLMAAHLGTFNGVELNSPQYTPAANEAWLPRLAPLFQPTGGQHRLPGAERLIGLGTDL